MTVTLNSRADFTLETYKRVAWGGAPVQIAPAAREKMKAARAYLMRLAERPEITIYGVNTGYGHHAKCRLDAEARQKHAEQPTFHRAASWGDAVPERVARGIVFARLTNFIEGHAAASPALADAVASMLDGAPLPPVPARGQGGAGEILSLSHLFLRLSEKHRMQPKDMLSLVNGSPAASALIADASLAARPRLTLSAEVFALAAEAFKSPHGHFAAELQGYWNNPYDTEALSLLRALMGPGHGGPRRPYQAPVSLRILPRVLGEALRAASLAEDIARHSLMAITDNPVVIPEDEQVGADPVISTGGYHNIQAVSAMDALVAAYTNLVVLAGRIAAKLQDTSASLLPPFLGYGEGRSYLGCLPMALVGYEEEMRMLAQPTLLPGSESGGFGQDDIASPVFLAWSKVDRAGQLFDQALATLAPIAVRALDVTGRPAPEAVLAIAELVAKHFPDKGDNVPMGEDIARLAEAFRTRIYSAQP
ncbi:aromatic amino acid lyase [Aestuariivirga sp.]|uniref:aromatic amino acid lyase n=1 Tax=Aestuariivirga sp. TaxID=2650926 RepID=UPI0039E70295